MSRRDDREHADLFAYDSGWPADLRGAPWRTTPDPEAPPAPRKARGLLLRALGMAAMLTGVGVLLADPLGAAIAGRRATSLGPIDQVVHTDLADAEALATHDGFDGVLPARTATVAARVTERRQTVELLRLLVVDGHDAAAFGDDPDSTGMTELDDLARGEVALREPVASRLGAVPGDAIVVTVADGRLDLVVSEVVPSIGVAAYGDVIVAPATLDDAGIAESSTSDVVLVSNAGDVVAGAAYSDEALAAISEALGPDVAVDRVKHELISDARRTTLLGTVGAAVVLGAIAAAAVVARALALTPSGRTRPLPAGGFAAS